MASRSTVAELLIKVGIDTAKAKSGLEDVAKTTGGLGSKFKGVAGAVGAGLAVGAVVRFGKSAVSAAQESETATKRLDAVFTAMGETTGNASKKAQDFATALSNKTGIDDEQIIKGQAMLATFKDVSSAVGRSEGIFNRATQAGADLAAAGFGSIETNAVQLGKALQDPHKGMTALAKAGVTFTDAQKKQIDAMQKSGDLLGAQKMILAGVEGQVKGTAEATGTAADKQTTAYENMQEALGQKLLPTIQTFQSMMTTVFGFIGDNANVMVPLILGIVALAAVLKGIALVGQVVTAVNTLMGASWLASVWPILLIIAAIAILIGVFILLYNKCTWFRDIVNAVMSFAVTAFNWVLNAAKGVFNWIKQNWPLLLAILTGPIGVAVLLISRNWDAVKAGASSVLNFIKGIAAGIGNALSSVASAISQPFIRGFQIVKDAVAAAVGWVTDRINSVKSVVTGAIDTVKGIYNTFARGWNGIQISIPEKKIGPVTVPGTGITWGLPDIPLLASGAYATRAMLAVVGEGPTPEVVSPEPMLRRLIRQESGATITLNVNVPETANPAETGRAVANVLRAYFVAGGRLTVPT